MEKLIRNFWRNVGLQNPVELGTLFSSKAIIRWHNTNEQFTAKEFVTATCKYPDKWESAIQRIDILETLVITATKVINVDTKDSFYATSFFIIENEKITSLDEYWGDNGTAPQWRIDLNIGKPISQK